MVRTCLLAFAILIAWIGPACAQQADVSSQMIKRAHAYLYGGLAKSPQNKEKISKVQERVDQVINACQNDSCIYSAYVDGIYDAVDVLKGRRTCPVSVGDLQGTWRNASNTGYYESLSLSFYKRKPSVHQFIVYKEKKSPDLDDGFGGWYWDKGRCTVKTREQVSTAGRVFNPGNDLLILDFDPAKHVMTVLDGAHISDFTKTE